MATSASTRRHEPCYKQHTAVDDARGVVLDVAVTTGAVSESRMIEAQVDAVRETTGRAIGTVTADAGYAYAKVFGGSERRRIDPVIPTRKDPSRSPVPLRRFRYDARHHLVKCPHGKILHPVRRLGRGQVFLSRVRLKKVVRETMASILPANAKTQSSGRCHGRLTLDGRWAGWSRNQSRKTKTSQAQYEPRATTGACPGRQERGQRGTAPTGRCGRPPINPSRILPRPVINSNTHTRRPGMLEDHYG